MIQAAKSASQSSLPPSVQSNSPSEVRVSATSGTPTSSRESSVDADDVTFGVPSTRDDDQETSDNEVSSDDRLSTRKRRYRFGEDDNTTPTVLEEEYAENDRSFSFSASSPHDSKSRGRHSDNSRLVVPSNISINANFFVLKDTISTLDATKLYDQCRVPGFINSISDNHTLIMKKAQYLIDNRVYSREDDWEILFPTLDKEDVPDWMNLLTVLEAAQLV